MTVNSFNVMSLGKVHLLDPSKVAYKDAIDILHDEFHRTRKSFIKIGFYLKHIRDNGLYAEDGYKNINEFAFAVFHLSQSTTSRYIHVCEQFSRGGNSPELDEKYEEYNISQLFEMITMTVDKIEQVTPRMSVREIRELKAPDKPVEEVHDKEKNIPGQTSIAEDFLEYMPEQAYATSHKEDKKKNYSCPENVGSCIRQEWGSGAEEQKAGQKECDKCWDHHTKLALNLSEEESIEEKDNVEESGIIDGEYRQLSAERQFSDCQEKEIPVKNEVPCLEESREEGLHFPGLKNADQRKEWLQNYKEWGLWYRDENIDVNYYKYDFPDGSRLICCEYLSREYDWADDIVDQTHYHLLEKNKPKYGGKKTYDQKFCHSTTSETYLIEFLKRFKKDKF